LPSFPVANEELNGNYSLLHSRMQDRPKDAANGQVLVVTAIFFIFSPK